jgi:hypothetical protein
VHQLAIVFVPHGPDLATHIATCVEYCKAQGYELFGVVQGDWKAVADALLTCSANILVVAREDHLPADRARVEIAGEMHRADAPRPTPTNRGPADRRDAGRRRPNQLN